MFGWEIAWGAPWFCLLLLLVPVLWWLSYKSLSGLGRWRRLMALTFRTVVYAGIVLALAEVQIKRTSEKLTVIYLLDQSESIPPHKRKLMLDYVVREVATHRNASRGDRAGVIVFGRDALIEIPPFADDLPSVGQIESQRELRTDGTNLAAALKLGQASFPEDGAKRVVVVTDGNENIGNARTLAPLLREQGIGLDVIGVELGDRGEVAVEKVVLPSNTRRGQPLETRIVLHNFGTQPVPGKLRLTRRLGASEALLSESDVVLSPGIKNVFTVQESEIESAGIFSYIATFEPANSADDRLTENNQASGFTYVRGRGRVLLIEDWEHRGEFDYLANRLRENELEVDIMPSNQLFSSLAELQAYDVVLLANVPRSSGGATSEVTNFSDEQIQMLVYNTEHMGCGLIMLGGRNSFGAGGWSNTDLEKAMPVDFQIKNSRINAVGALVLIMHASEIAQGNYWQKVIGIEALKALGPMDYCGVVQWNDSIGGEEWLWGKPSGMLVASPNNRRMMTSRLNRMAPGDMPFFDPGLQMALNSLKGTNAAMKQVIMISDGDPADPSPSLLDGFKQAGIKITTVAVGSHGPAESSRLQMIADATGGNYYQASNPRLLPRIYQREARRVAQPLIREPENGVRPQIMMDHEVHGLDVQTPLPRIFGFVMTTKKQNALVEVSMLSPDPPDRDNATILASWTYGLGRTAVFTSDAGVRWANEWTGWEQYDKFFTQMVRWAMRPADDGSKFTISTDFRDGKVRVVVNALQSGDTFLNLDELLATAIGPDMKPFPVRIEQVAPGRYVGEFSADDPGSYYLTVNTGVEQIEVDGQMQRRSRAPLITGVTVPYSPEFNDRESNLALLRYLAAVLPKGGEAGTVISEDLRPDVIESLIRQFDTFRHNLAKAVSIQDVWPLVLLVVAGVFFADVLVRRLALDWEWLARIWHAVVRRFGGSPVDTEEKEARLEQLRSRKAAVAEQLDERRAAARFEPQSDVDVDAQQILQEAAGDDASSRAQRPRSQPALTPEATPNEESYTARLLKAKQQVRKDGQQ